MPRGRSAFGLTPSYPAKKAARGHSEGVAAPCARLWTTRSASSGDQDRRERDCPPKLGVRLALVRFRAGSRESSQRRRDRRRLARYEGRAPPVRVRRPRTARLPPARRSRPARRCARREPPDGRRTPSLRPRRQPLDYPRGRRGGEDGANLDSDRGGRQLEVGEQIGEGIVDLPHRAGTVEPSAYGPAERAVEIQHPRQMGSPSGRSRAPRERPLGAHSQLQVGASALQ
jgi:hypothetical protein